nr:MAG TPA: hypothetical protein [Caudoviricetes sp.]
MNEEEKKAIENIKELKTLFEIDDKKNFEATPLAQKEMAKNLKTLLNLIDKMKNCINILDDELKERDKTINEKEIIIEKLQKENEELKNNIRKNENELEFDVNCDWIALQKILDESEKSNEYISYKDEKWIKEKYCIPVQKIKDKIEKEIKYHERNILEIENITMLKGKTAKEEAKIEFNKYAIVVLKKILQKLREGEN